MPRPLLTLAASMLITFVLGSVHAFSVFIVPLETALNLPRSEVSLIYSFALVSITVAVLFGYRIYTFVPAWQMAGIACLTAAAGLVVAASATSWLVLFIGYSLLFGVSNGLGYGYTLQLVGRVLPEIRGFAMGAVTAAYALGSILFAKVIAYQIMVTSIPFAFISLAFAMVTSGVIAASLLVLSRAEYVDDSKQEVDRQKISETGRLILYWLAYMSAVFSGLMAIGHAVGIALSKGASPDQSVWAAMVIGIGSAAGGFLIGWLVDRLSIRAFLFGLPVISAIALLLLALVDSPILAISLLLVVGFAYGSIIAVYPVAIATYFGEQAAKAYGLVFTAWGLAGLAAPWAAGLIYDNQSNYQLALVLASITAFISALTVWRGRL